MGYHLLVYKFNYIAIVILFEGNKYKINFLFAKSLSLMPRTTTQRERCGCEPRHHGCMTSDRTSTLNAMRGCANNEPH